MTGQLEHANLTVGNIEETVRFLTTALPEFKVRGGGESAGVKWLHLGTDLSYVTLNQSTGDETGDWTRSGATAGFNHLGFVVDDVDGLQQRLENGGYEVSTMNASHPYRKQVYFRNQEGVEWEFVQYFSADPAQRNDYTQ